MSLTFSSYIEPVNIYKRLQPASSFSVLGFGFSYKFCLGTGGSVINFFVKLYIYLYALFLMTFLFLVFGVCTLQAPKSLREWVKLFHNLANGLNPYQMGTTSNATQYIRL